MNKHALIIGGSTGIGLASAKKLGQKGFSIFIIHRDRRSVLESIEKEFDEIRKVAPAFSSFNIDATNPEKISETISLIQDSLPKEESIDVLIHSLSRGNLKPLVNDDGPELSEADISLTINSMCSNLLSWIQHLRKQKMLMNGARVLALTSEGNNKYWSGYGAVGMAKAALETMVKYLSVELAPMGIQVNAIQAGVTDTPSLRLIPGSDQLLEGAKKRNPNSRITSPENVADAVYLLSREEASWINGSIIHVDGGEHFI